MHVDLFAVGGEEDVDDARARADVAAALIDVETE